MKLKQTIVSDQRGAILLLSLMLLTLVMFSTLSLASILMTELRSARFSDNSIVAHYAAESGSEQALFLLKEARSIDELIGSDPYDQLFDIPENKKERRVDALAVSPDLERRYTLTEISTTSDTFVAYNIPLNTSVQLDIFDPLQETSVSPLTNVSDIHINWEVEQCSTQTANELELTVLSYITTALGIDFEVIPGGSNPRKFYYPCNCGGTGVCDTRDVTLPPNRFYHLILRPIDGDVKKVSIDATDSNNQSVGLPSQIFIRTIGRYRDASQEVTVQTPWDNGTSDIFNYVIFSDASLIKNILDSSVEAFPSLCGYCTNNPVISCSDNVICGGGSTTCQESNPYKGACPLDTGASVGEGNNPANISQNNNGLCNARCSGYTYCGDNTIQNPNGVAKGGPAGTGNEDCDDGNISNADLCTTTCVNTRCGDGYVNQPNAVGLNGLAPGFSENCDEKFPCDATHTQPNCKSNTVIGACKTDCSGRVIDSGVPCTKDCPILD